MKKRICTIRVTKSKTLIGFSVIAKLMCTFVFAYDFFLMARLNLALLFNIYIFIAIALDESIFLDVLHFPMKNIKSRDLEATPLGGATSKPIQ